jgi:hypothetical protein
LAKGSPFFQQRLLNLTGLDLRQQAAQRIVMGQSF